MFFPALCTGCMAAVVSYCFLAIFAFVVPDDQHARYLLQLYMALMVILSRRIREIAPVEVLLLPSRKWKRTLSFPGHDGHQIISSVTEFRTLIGMLRNWPTRSHVRRCLVLGIHFRLLATVTLAAKDAVLLWNSNGKESSWKWVKDLKWLKCAKRKKFRVEKGKWVWLDEKGLEWARKTNERCSHVVLSKLLSFVGLICCENKAYD